jgi:hypothetical protein
MLVTANALRRHKTLVDQLNLLLFSGDVYQAFPAVRRLQEGCGCGSTRLHRVRYEIVSRPLQKPLLPHDVVAGKSLYCLRLLVSMAQ